MSTERRCDSCRWGDVQWAGEPYEQLHCRIAEHGWNPDVEATWPKRDARRDEYDNGEARPFYVGGNDTYGNWLVVTPDHYCAQWAASDRAYAEGVRFSAALDHQQEKP